jgi:hypothetical protein
MRKVTSFFAAAVLALGLGGCAFMEDRVLDFVDIFGVKWVFGKGMKAGVELGNSYLSTEYEDFFAAPLPLVSGLRRHLLPPNPVFGYYDFEKYGFQSRDLARQGRRLPRPRRPQAARRRRQRLPLRVGR